MLGIDNKEVELGGNANAGGPFYGKLEDGTQVQSDFFDIGHQMMLIKGADLVPAPDADHIVYLPIGLAGSNKRYFITTKGGSITSMNLEDTHGGVKKDVNASAQTNSEMENTLSTELGAEKTYDEKEAVKKEEKMQDDSSRLDAMEEQLNQLRVDIAEIFEAMKGKKADMAVEEKDEEAARKKLEEKDEMQGKPNDGGPSKTNMSAAKKFTGAPVEEKTNLSGLFVSKKEGTMLGSVLAKMSNSKF